MCVCVCVRERERAMDGGVGGCAQTHRSAAVHVAAVLGLVAFSLSVYAVSLASRRRHTHRMHKEESVNEEEDLEEPDEEEEEDRERETKPNMFLEDEGGIWGLESKSGSSSEELLQRPPVTAAEAASSSSCGHVCGSCQKETKKNKKKGLEDASFCCSSNSVHSLKSATGVSPALFLADDGKSSSCGKILFASQTGNSRRLAEKLQKELLEDANLCLDLVDPAAYEPEDLVKERLVILVASTWEDGKAPPNASFLARWLEESSKDFRVGSGLLRECRSVLLLSCKGSM